MSGKDYTPNEFLNWYPGHMTKTMRSIQKRMQDIDIIIELLDARIPSASKNPYIDRYAGNKPRFFVFNKADLADPDQTVKWMDYYGEKGYRCFALSSKSQKQAADIVARILEQLPVSSKKYKTRAMILGIPNVGKSTFINAISGRAAAKTADTPGVTRGEQWISLKNIDLLDMPGVLWPKLENQNDAVLLAITGAISDRIFDPEEIACFAISLLKDIHPSGLTERYKLDDETVFSLDSYDLLEAIAMKRGMIVSKGNPDTLRSSIMLIDEIRAGLTGRITFEKI